MCFANRAFRECHLRFIPKKILPIFDNVIVMVVKTSARICVLDFRFRNAIVKKSDLNDSMINYDWQWSTCGGMHNVGNFQSHIVRTWWCSCRRGFRRFEFESGWLKAAICLERTRMKLKRGRRWMPL